MAYNALNNLIDAYIYANGVQAITGQILNGVLKAMVSQLGGGYNLMGVAAPASSPAVNDEPLAYFAATAGTYTNFDGIVLAAGEVAVLLTSGNGSWEKQTIYNVPTGTADLENTANFITNAVTDLVNYYTKTEIDTTLANYPTLAALATALADYYTKAETDTKLGNYYRKVETYDKDEVDSIVAALSRQEYIVAWDGLAAPDVSAIPAGVTVTYSGTTYTGTLAASASTMNKIYMVWNGTAYDMYGTSQDGGYSWVPMGTTTVDLSQYATKAEVSQLEAKVDELGEYETNPEFVRLITDEDGRILWGIKSDGTIYFGADVPPQVKDYVNEKIAELSLDEYEDMVAFLSDYLDSDTTLKTLIDSKLDVEGLDPDALNSVQVVENPEYIQATTDSEDKILEAITSEGVKQINIPIDTPSAAIEHVENPEWISVTTDKEGKILEGITSEGKKKVLMKTNFEEGIEGYATNEDVEDLKEYVNEKDNEIKEIIGYDNREEVPSYYFANDYLQNKVDTIKSIYSKCASNGDIFFFSTDEHWEYNAKKSPALVKYISERVKINKLFSGGDNTQLISLGGTSNKQNPAVDDFLSLREKTFNGKLYYAIGNHEYLTGYFDEPELFDNIDMNNWHDMTRFSGLDEIVYGDSARHYYYIDNKQKKIRYIFLSSFKQKEIQQETQGYRITAESDYNDSQVAWLQDVALNVENGWTIIVITHFLSSINPIISDGHCTQVIRYLSEDSKKIAKVLLQYNGNGEIAGVISGHLHSDGIVMIDDDYVGLTGTEATGKSIPEIVTTCDSGGKNGSQRWILNGDYSSRAEGSITEQAFDIVIVDKNTKKLSLVRIGAPAYNLFEQDSGTGYYPLSGDVEIREVNYGQA